MRVKWNFQAEFIQQAFEAFISQKDKLMGQLFFRWADQPTCWQCGQPACPSETAWGLVDIQNQEKPAFEAYKGGLRDLRKALA